MSASIASPLKINFAPPDAGWIDMTINDGENLVEYSLSNVYDPFRPNPYSDGSHRYWLDFTSWLEQICETGAGIITIDLEHECVDLEVFSGGAPTECLFCCIEHHLQQRVDFRMSLTLREFVSGFYCSLVGFWEGAQLRDNWAQWEYPDEYEEGRPIWDEDKFSMPWNVRSEKVERWLEGTP